MEISLIRHGKSKHMEKQPITSREFKIWVRKYDSSGVIGEEKYPPDALLKITKANIILTSDLARSIESAKLLLPPVAAVSDKLFRETELPTPSVWKIRLAPGTWAVIFRVLWLCGYSKNCESYIAAKIRAATAAQLLIDYAQEHKSVALVGHGFFNLLIAKQLQKKGWQGHRKTATKHWSCTTYYL